MGTYGHGRGMGWSKSRGRNGIGINIVIYPCMNSIINRLIRNAENKAANNNIENQQAFDLAVCQREIYGNNGPLLRLKGGNEM